MAWKKKNRKKLEESAEVTVEPVVEETPVDAPIVYEVADSNKSSEQTEVAYAGYVSTPELEAKESPVVVEEVKVEKPKASEPKVVAKRVDEAPKKLIKKVIKVTKKPEPVNTPKNVGWKKFFPGLK